MKLSKQYEDLRVQIPYLDESLPLKEQTGALVVNLDEIAVKNNSLMTSISFTPAEPNDYAQRFGGIDATLKALKMSVTLETSLDDLEKIIKHIEEFPRPINISSIGINLIENQNNAAAGSNLDCIVSLDLITFYKPN